MVVVLTLSVTGRRRHIAGGEQKLAGSGRLGLGKEEGGHRGGRRRKDGGGGGR